MTLTARYYAPTGLVGAACAAEGGSSCYRFYVATLRSSPPRRCAWRLTPRLSLHCTWRSQVCRALVPGWSCVPNAVLSITVIDGGLTNRLFRCARTTAPLFSPADAPRWLPNVRHCAASNRWRQRASGQPRHWSACSARPVRAPTGGRRRCFGSRCALLLLLVCSARPV